MVGYLEKVASYQIKLKINSNAKIKRGVVNLKTGKESSCVN